METRLRMTEDEFEKWRSEDVRAEFVDGEVIVMTPVPRIHDDLFHARLLGGFLEMRPVGTVRGPEFEARLRPGLRRVPDLLFMAREHEERVKRTHVEGAPDAVFEIVSTESIERHWRYKHEEYQEAGVWEYWLIDPAYEAVRLHRLVNGRYEVVPEAGDRLASEVIPGLWLKPEWLWQRPLPGTLVCPREIGALK